MLLLHADLIVSASLPYAATKLLARVALARAEKLRAEAAFAPRFAPAFNALSVVEPGELHLTRILRWLLDERESHGQGALFRDSFVRTILKEEPTDWRAATVSCEVATVDRRGRIDLLVISEDKSRSVAVENKPWAGWQEDQLARYLNDQSAVRTSTRVHALIGGPNPDAAPALAQHWGSRLPQSVTASSYHELVAWLEIIIPAVRAERVRSFVADLAQFCRSSIIGGSDMNDTSQVVELISSGDAEVLQAARAIADAMHAEVPKLITEKIARRLGGSCEMIQLTPTIKVRRHEVDLYFVLMTPRPWVGVIDLAAVTQLSGELKWATEPQWPRWIRLTEVNADGKTLADMLSYGRTQDVDPLVLRIADAVLGKLKK